MWRIMSFDRTCRTIAYDEVSAVGDEEVISVHPDAWKRYTIVLANSVKQVTKLFRFSVYSNQHEVELYNMATRRFENLLIGSCIDDARAVLARDEQA